MDKKPDEVKKDGTDASGAGQEVKKEDAGASAAGVDLAETLSKTLEQLAKAESDRDNYKTGLLKAKGKAGDDGVDADADDFQDKVAQAVKLALADSEVVKNAEAAKTLTEQVIRRNRELETAMANKSQGATGGGTSSESKMVVGDNQLSQDQITSLKARGWDDTKIERFKANLTKVH